MLDFVLFILTTTLFLPLLAWGIDRFIFWSLSNRAS
jgi:hypothetical protein